MWEVHTHVGGSYTCGRFIHMWEVHRHIDILVVHEYMVHIHMCIVHTHVSGSYIIIRAFLFPRNGEFIHAK